MRVLSRQPSAISHLLAPLRRCGFAPPLAALPLCLLASSLAAQSVLTGTVRADSSGRPLAGVEVVIVGSQWRTLTDGSGRYWIPMLPAGRRLALFRSVGFRPVQEWVVLGSADTVWSNVLLIPQAVRLDSIVVTASPDQPRGLGLEAFEERRRLGFGRFIDSATLRRNEHVPLVQLLGRLQGIEFARVPGETGQIAAKSARRQVGGPCFMQVILDGVVLYRSVAPAGVQSNALLGINPPTDLQMFSVAGLAAVEVYRGASETPIEFGGSGAGCGTVVLWTRRQ
jgi:hypothetical protein